MNRLRRVNGTIKTDQNEKETYKARFCCEGLFANTRHRLSGNIRTHSTREHDTHVTATRSANDLIVHQMDVKTAYLNAPIDREIYIEQPEGFRKSGNSGETLVCKLKRSLYGLKQSGRNWNNLLHDYLANEKFT